MGSCCDSTINLKIKQGATFRKRVTWKAGPEGTPVVVNLTGYTARMQIRSDIASPDVLVELTTENGGIVLGGVNGTIDLFISDEATGLYEWDTGVYDIELQSSIGDVKNLFGGNVSVNKEVTRGM